MAGTGKTTQDLRQTLFDAIEAVSSGKMETKDALTISKLADNIIKTADLELRYSKTCSELDMENQGITTGPILLTDKT